MNKRIPSFDTLMEWTNGDLNPTGIRVAGIKIAGQNYDIPPEKIREWVNDDESFLVRTEAMNICKGKGVPLDILKEGLEDTNDYVRLAAIEACKGRKDIPLDFITMCLSDPYYEVRYAAFDVCQDIDIPIETIENWLNGYNIFCRQAAIRACIGKADRVYLIEKGIINDSTNVQYDAMLAYGPYANMQRITEWAENKNSWLHRAAAMHACKGRYVSFDFLRKGLNDESPEVRIKAIKACKGRKNVPYELVEKAMKDPYPEVRLEAIKVCASGVVGVGNILRKALRDQSVHVRLAAIEVCNEYGIRIPLVKSFIPPDVVYKKCLNNVIVEASIPNDAHVRGGYGVKCRASKAFIITVNGRICGENVGVSAYDFLTTYYAGDEIEIDNFDIDHTQCSTGFHFFCTKEEAEEYALC